MNTKRTPISVRFETKYTPEPNSGCWLWLGAKVPHGYGEIWDGQRPKPAHIVAYELHIGQVPAGLELDHKCRNRGCVNPWHLEPVTHQENCRRGDAGRLVAAKSAARTHCGVGHLLDEENTLRYRGRRACKKCNTAKMRRLRAKWRNTTED